MYHAFATNLGMPNVYSFGSLDITYRGKFKESKENIQKMTAVKLPFRIYSGKVGDVFTDVTSWSNRTVADDVS